MVKVLSDVGIHLEDIAAYERERTPMTIANLLLQNMDGTVHHTILAVRMPGNNAAADVRDNQ